MERSVRLSVPLILVLLNISCRPDRPTAPAIAAVNMAASVDGVPSRDADTRLFRWSTASDSALWSEISANDSLVIVGVKEPQARRGFYRGLVLVTAMAKESMVRAIRAIGQLRVVSADTLMPQVTVKVFTRTALSLLRGQPFVDYVEPRALRAQSMDSWACGSGNQSSGNDHVVNTPGFNLGYDIAPYQFVAMMVHAAWPYSTGNGVVIGLTDTGVDSYSLGDASEWSLSHFDEGLSAGRPDFQQLLFGHTVINCDHGSRSAGLMAAPRNGRSMVGVAYRSALISVYQDTDVVPDQGVARDAIRAAAEFGAPILTGKRVISMPWAILSDLYQSIWSDVIADEIRYWSEPVAGRDVVFVGAAGTSPDELNQNTVVFPAVMNEVLSVSAAELPDPMIRPGSVHHGPELDVIAYTHGLTTGTGPYSGSQVFTSLGGSSGATAIAAGIAALVRARYPTWNNVQVRERMISTGGVLCGNLASWHRMLNAEAAVGGLCVPNGRPYGTPSVTFDRAAYGDTRTETIEEYCLNFSGGVGPFDVDWPNSLPGSAGSGPYCRRYTFHRGTYTANIHADIRDLGVPGAIERSYSITVSVVDLDNNPGCPECFRLKGRTPSVVQPSRVRRSVIR